MNSNKVFKESVRGIVEFALKQGSIDDRFISRGRAIEGTIAHGKLQDDNERVYKNYEKEVKLQCNFNIEDIKLCIEGRCDGIIKDNNIPIIEEIKSTYKNLIYIDEYYNELHWAQGKFYGYIYCLDNNIDQIVVRLSYYNINTSEVKSFDILYSFSDLTVFVEKIVNKYINVLIKREKFIKERDRSILDVKFPFKEYRKGQRELAVSVYNCIKQKGILFAQAPTGIGKTISTIFPAIKNIGIHNGNKVIYLTAKTITRTVAEEAYIKLIKNGLKIKVITITAKEKICLNTEVKCNPEDCIYARDYYSKIDNVIEDILDNEDTIFREEIIKYSKKHKICPFELSLDLANWCDSIICDYNYAFDPRVRLIRIFEEQGKDNILLIDEAHNLVDRARNMYSGEIYKSKVVFVNKVLKGIAPTLYKYSNLINKEMIKIRRELEEINDNIFYHNYKYDDLIKYLRAFVSEADSFLVKNKGISGYDEVLEFYYDARSFISVNDLYSKEYTTILKKEKSELTIKVFCIDPSKNTSEIFNKSYSSIIFSATLSPFKYYIDLLGGNKDSYRIKLQSPFKKENLDTYIYNLDMRYKFRERNIDELCSIINKFINEIKGNYMIFLPSFEYTKKVYDKYIVKYGNDDVILHKEGLKEEEKEDFIKQFHKNKNIVAFTVVGGMFSEGIDLPGEQLIGAVIVGVGFPMVSVENNIISDYFGQNGFDYAYTFPGINKVIQSAGRVIRTDEDKGRILLIDNRYFNFSYRRLIPSEWKIKKI